MSTCSTPAPPPAAAPTCSENNDVASGRQSLTTTSMRDIPREAKTPSYVSLDMQTPITSVGIHQVLVIMRCCQGPEAVDLDKSKVILQRESRPILYFAQSSFRKFRAYRTSMYYVDKFKGRLRDENVRLACFRCFSEAFAQKIEEKIPLHSAPLPDQDFEEEEEEEEEEEDEGRSVS
eukprot:763236-Hanusia_phi.AAC.2